MTNFILLGSIILLSFSSIQTSSAQSTPQAVVTTNKVSKNILSESQKIEQLITTLRSMEGAMFIRNGSEHTPQEAADHLETKWQKHSNKIRTAEDFIEHLATKSSRSGEKYMIRFSDGKQVPAADVLHKKLEQLDHPKHK